MKENCLKYWLEDNVLDYADYNCCIDFEICIFDFKQEEIIFVGPIGEIPKEILSMVFVNIEFDQLYRRVIINIDSGL